MIQQTSTPQQPRSGASKKAIYVGIILILVVVIAAFAFVFLNSRAHPDPQITDITVGFDNYGRTYRLFVTVHNNGVSGQVKVFAEVKAVQNGNVGFTQTQDKSVYLDNGGSTTITFEFNSDWLALSDIQLSRNVWAIAL